MHELELIIPVGKENAIHQKDLAASLGITTASLKNMIQNARREGKGVRIMSGNCGYWLSESREELKAFYYHERKQATSRLKTLQNVRRVLKETEGQESLSDVFPEQIGDDHNE